jgi:hypothetical protein
MEQVARPSGFRCLHSRFAVQPNCSRLTPVAGHPQGFDHLCMKVAEVDRDHRELELVGLTEILQVTLGRTTWHSAPMAA